MWIQSPVVLLRFYVLKTVGEKVLGFYFCRFCWLSLLVVNYHRDWNPLCLSRWHCLGRHHVPVIDYALTVSRIPSTGS